MQDRNNASIWTVCRWATIPIRSQPEVEMTNTIRQQIHHPVCSDSNCPGCMSQSPPLLKIQGMLLWQRWHRRQSHAFKPDTSAICYDTLSIKQNGPAEDEQCPTWEEEGLCERRSLCVCDLDPGWGGEACGGILFNKKASFVLLLNVNEQYKGELDVHLWGIRQHRSIGGVSVWIEVTLCLTKEVPLTGSPSKCSGALSESRGCGGGRRPDSHIGDPCLVGAAGVFVQQHVYSQLSWENVYVWHWRSLFRINNLMRCDVMLLLNSI